MSVHCVRTVMSSSWHPAPWSSPSTSPPSLSSLFSSVSFRLHRPPSWTSSPSSSSSYVSGCSFCHSSTTPQSSSSPPVRSSSSSMSLWVRHDDVPATDGPSLLRRRDSPCRLHLSVRSHHCRSVLCPSLFLDLRCCSLLLYLLKGAMAIYFVYIARL